MSSRRLKASYFIIEGLNSFATVYYSYYLYFFMQKRFGFDNKANLALAAFNGLVCMIAAWQGGKFAQRAGYFTALKLGFAIMAASLTVGSQINSATGHVLVMAAMVIGMCFTWPTLEALVSEGETRAGIQRMVGIYNMTWAGTGALAYFSGGAMLDKFGLNSLFYVPAGIFSIQFILVFLVEAAGRQAHAAALANAQTPGYCPVVPPPQAESTEDRSKAKAFLRMAWLANPFAYIAINTLVAVIPGLSVKLGLSTMLAGFYCSIWCFARVGSFLILWLWDGWHYRFRWLLLAYVALVATFAVLLLVPHLTVLIAAQIVFGLALGLIYYSSLFYSMDVGETKGEHGGIHEAAIGLGNFAGPAVGAVSLVWVPQIPNSGAIAVSAVLLIGLGGLLAIWRTSSPSP